MTWITENPVPLLVVAGIAELGLLIAFFTTRLVKTLAAVGIVAAVTVLLLLIEWLIVTDREKVYATTMQLVADVRTSDVQGVLSNLSTRPEAASLRALSERLLPTVSVRQLGVVEGPEIEIDLPPAPPSGRGLQRRARVRLRVLGSVETQGVAHVVEARSTLLFILEGDRWVLLTIEEYQGAGENYLRSAPGATLELP